jgi:putative oxidoreductase
LQRLFSNFANGWPGAGILLQRGLAGSILVYNCFLQVSEKHFGMVVVPEIIGAIAGSLLLLGLWTPIAGATALVTQLWAFLVGISLSASDGMAGMLGLTIAMIGPGAWSIDARIFGRKHIESRHPQK